MFYYRYNQETKKQPKVEKNVKMLYDQIKDAI